MLFNQADIPSVILFSFSLSTWMKVNWTVTLGRIGRWSFLNSTRFMLSNIHFHIGKRRNRKTFLIATAKVWNTMVGVYTTMVKVRCIFFIDKLDSLTNNVFVVNRQTLKEAAIKRPIQKHNWFTMPLLGERERDDWILPNKIQMLFFQKITTIIYS